MRKTTFLVTVWLLTNKILILICGAVRVSAIFNFIKRIFCCGLGSFRCGLEGLKFSLLSNY